MNIRVGPVPSQAEILMFGVSSNLKYGPKWLSNKLFNNCNVVVLMFTRLDNEALCVFTRLGTTIESAGVSPMTSSSYDLGQTPMKLLHLA